MDKERIECVKTVLARENLDALICRLPENVLLLCGYWPLNGWSFLLFPQEGKPICIVPYCEEQEAQDELWEAKCIPFLFGTLAAGNPYEDIARALKDATRDNRYNRVGFEGSFESVAPPWNVAEPAIPANVTRGFLEEVFGKKSLLDTTETLNELRARKTPMEQQNLRRVNEIAALGLKAFQEKVDVGVTGIELVSHVESTIMSKGTGYKGARRVRAFAQVGTGAKETAIGFRPMEITTARRMRSGDLALLELAVVADGFWADRTRVRVAGTSTEQQRSVFEVIRNAQEAAIAMDRVGVTAAQVDEAARAIVRDAGYEKEFLHVTGHGLGFRYHEPTPLIAPGNSLVLEKGMVHTVEPGIYFPEMGGIRLEENVVVTETQAEILGTFERELY